MEEEVVMKEGVIQGGILARNCLGDALEDGLGNSKGLVADGMEEDLLPLAGCSRKVLDQGEGALEKIDMEFLRNYGEGQLAFEKEDKDCMILGGNDGSSVGSETVNVVGGGPPSKVVFDWKKAVVEEGRAEKRLEMSSCGQGKEDGKGALVGGRGVKVAPLPGGRKVEEHVWVNNHCRNLVFDVKEEFL